MASSSSRMLRLLSLLQTHRYWAGSDLAERLDVSSRTLRRDVDRLRELGYPVDASRGVSGGYQLQAGASLPPLLLEDDEAVAIAVGLRTAAGGVISGIEESSVRALTKIVQVMPPRLRRRVDALQDYTVPVTLSGPTVDAGALAVIAQACRDDERLEFGYTRRDGEQAKRLVEPHRLVSLGRRWYLVGWDLTRHDWRIFRVDRMADARVTGMRFRQRELPGGDAAAYVSDGIAQRPMQYEVIVRVSLPADAVRDQVGRWAEIEDAGPDACRMMMRTDDLSWPVLALGGLGAEFDIESPDELTTYVRELSERFARCVG